MNKFARSLNRMAGLGIATGEMLVGDAQGFVLGEARHLREQGAILIERRFERVAEMRDAFARGISVGGIVIVHGVSPVTAGRFAHFRGYPKRICDGTDRKPAIFKQFTSGTGSPGPGVLQFRRSVGAAIGSNRSQFDDR